MIDSSGESCGNLHGRTSWRRPEADSDTEDSDTEDRDTEDSDTEDSDTEDSDTEDSDTERSTGFRGEHLTS